MARRLFGELIVRASVAALALIVCVTASAQLRPDQERLVEHLLSGLEPAMRPSFRADFEKLAGAMSPEEVRAVLTSAGVDPNSPPPPKDESGADVATAELAEYHRKQYEPVYRASWNAQKAFDDLVAAQLESKCPDRHRYAIVMGPARYEVPQFSPAPIASANADNDLKIVAGIVPLRFRFLGRQDRLRHREGDGGDRRSLRSLDHDRGGVPRTGEAASGCRQRPSGGKPGAQRARQVLPPGREARRGPESRWPVEQRRVLRCARERHARPLAARRAAAESKR